ncbi:hypothetical protein IMZ08_09950 [Bacillus luteolus]|uniref:Uncharacterized protein n=1 Tax=Litchfieldia luteola TaxID=682179 RepID=A0ABR9QIT6_9BACI|nr:hypothetical protein [Cytobacillus luteolus]MBE4908379.1 hypothetical protein [Cytobacillus luteolus]MBP1943167.1 hypothetical protein [Cytobacillus luteolus]
MKTKLILIEGLPGFGKSTTARLVHNILAEMNVEAELFLEGNLDHPADFEGVAYYSKQDFEELLSTHTNFKDLLLSHVIEKENGYFLPYHKVNNVIGSSLPSDLTNNFFQKDIYELPLEQNIELITQNWIAFAENALRGNKVYIFECCFIQNPITVGMVKYGAEKEIITNYIKGLAQSVKALEPILFYVDQADLDYSFKKAIQERPKEWFEGFVNYYTQQGYGKENELEGLEGTLTVLKVRKALEMDVFSQLDMNKHIILNNYSQEEYRNKLKTILDSETI